MAPSWWRLIPGLIPVGGQLDMEGRDGLFDHALRERADDVQPLRVRVDQPKLAQRQDISPRDAE